MDAVNGEVKIPIKIHVDRGKNKVLFAEADNDFVDTLFSFLTLPMGTIIRLLKQHSGLQLGAIGSFGSLYESVENLPANLLWSEGCREMLLKPKSAAEFQCLRLKLNVDDSGPTTFFICGNWECSLGDIAYLSTCADIKCRCGMLMNNKIRILGVTTQQGKDNSGVFVSETSSFIVTDDLQVLPNLPTSVVELFKKFGYSDLNAIDEINLNVGSEEMLNLLNCSLQSKSPMTDAFLSKGVSVSSMVKSKLGNSAGKKMGETTERSVTIKILVQKSSNKVLLAQAGGDFVDFLFSFLTIPLGGVACILRGDLAVGSIGNLYASVSILNSGEQNDIKSHELKEMLVTPKLATLHLCKNQIFSLSEAKTTQYYCLSEYNGLSYTGYLSLHGCSSKTYWERCTPTSLKNPKIEDKYTKPATFVVTDELAVSPLSTFSAVSFFKKSNVQLSDVEEHVISIGLEEAQKILKAAFESSSVLTNAGLNVMAKHIKQETP